tara:strand:+ start:95 stop:418 length:324 start_codon:yes stop_codon:yes gene_type:complete
MAEDVRHLGAICCSSLEHLRMRARVVCDITQEQLDAGYDVTMLSLHRRFVEWLLSWEIPIVGYSLGWHPMEDETSHLMVTADLYSGSDVSIDREFFDDAHLGSGSDG